MTAYQTQGAMRDVGVGASAPGGPARSVTASSAPIASIVVLAGCVPPRRSAPSRVTSREIFGESFDEPAAIQASWTVVTPTVLGASAGLEDAALRLTMPANAEGEAVLRHRLDVSTLRGK
jgi:hypothetical protein